MTFDKQRHLIKVQGGRVYLPVSARLVWFREVHPEWSIETQIVEISHEKQFAVFRASVKDADGRLISTATKKEDVKGFGDYIEKAETGAVGRALGMAGFSTDSDPDMDDGKNGDPAHIVDSPQPAPRPPVTPSSRFTDSRGGYSPRPQAGTAQAAPQRAAANMDDDPFAGN